MEGARVALIEDREQMRRMMRLLLEDNGHEVVAEASDLDEALALVDDMADGVVEADVVLLDGNLQPATDTGEDARRVSERLQNRGVTTAVLGFSLSSMERYGIQVTADPGKDPTAVMQAIAEL